MDGVRGMLESLMRPPPGAEPVLDIGAMLSRGSRSAAAAAASSTDLTGAGESSMRAQQPGVRGRPDPARSLMGAIAKGVLLQQQKERLQTQVRFL